MLIAGQPGIFLEELGFEIKGKERDRIHVAIKIYYNLVKNLQKWHQERNI